MSFATVDEAGSYRPSIGEEVRLVIDGNTLFAGTIQETIESNPNGTATVQVQVRCTDFGSILDRRIVNNNFIPGTTAEQIAEALVTAYLEDEGITFQTHGDPGTDLGEDIPLIGRTVADAFSWLKASTGWDWFVDFDKVLHFYDPAAGWEAAPFSIADDDGNVFSESVKVRRFRGEYRNRQWVRTSIPTGALFQDQLVLDATPPSALRILYTATPGWIPTPFGPGFFGPRVFVQGTLNGRFVDAIPLPRVLGGPGLGAANQAFDFALGRNPSNPNDPNTYLIANPNADLSDIGDIQSIQIESPLREGANTLIYEQDLAEIATRQAAEGGTGLYEAVEDLLDIEDEDTARARALGILERFGEIPMEITFETDRLGLAPGQVIDIELTRPLVPMGTYYIDQVSYSEVGRSLSAGSPFVRSSVRALNTAGLPGAMERARRFREHEKPSRARHGYYIEFLLAKTVEGAPNPGIIVKQNAVDVWEIVQQKGLISEVSGIFNTPPTGQSITMDILWSEDNGDTFTTILGGGVLEITAGQTTPTVILLNTPQRVKMGDLIKIDVLQVGSGEPGKDGLVRLRVLT